MNPKKELLWGLWVTYDKKYPSVCRVSMGPKIFAFGLRPDENKAESKDHIGKRLLSYFEPYEEVFTGGPSFCFEGVWFGVKDQTL